MQDHTSLIPNSDDKFVGFILKELFLGGTTGPVKGRNEELSLLLVLALILIVGTEPFKILLRKNIGKLSISMGRIVLSFFLYLIWATIIAFIAYEISNSEQSYTGIIGLWLSSTILWITFAFYILFAFITLITGIIKYSRANKLFNADPDFNQPLGHIFRGESLIFKSNPKKAGSYESIWVIKEPILCLVISIVISVFNVFLGFPLLMSSISFWFNEWYQVNNVWESQTRKIVKAQMKVLVNQKNFDEENPSRIVVE